MLFSAHHTALFGTGTDDVVMIRLDKYATIALRRD